MGKGIRVIVGVVIIGVLAALAGCGGSDDDATVSKSEFVQQATLVCNEGEREREEAITAAVQRYQEAEGRATNKLRDQAAFMVLKTYEEMTADLAELDMPAGDEKEIEAAIEAMEKAASDIRADPSIARNSRQPFGEPNEHWKAYGLNSCIA